MEFDYYFGAKRLGFISKHRSCCPLYSTPKKRGIPLPSGLKESILSFCHHPKELRLLESFTIIKIESLGITSQ
ncbi:MAG TPA: hypothetical protein VIV55_01340, partial [Flavobacterium sp.]